MQSFWRNDLHISEILLHLTPRIDGSGTMQGDTTFRKALDRFRDSLTDQQRIDFHSTTLNDVEVQIQKIQDRYGSTKQLRHMNRLSKFLEAMKQLEEVVSVFLNVSSSAAFIWVRCPPIFCGHTQIRAQ